MDVEHGDADRHLGDDGLDGGLRSAFAGVDERDVSGGAAHVEGDDAVEARELRDAKGADDAAGWPGEDGADGLVRGSSGRHDAARGLHDVHGAPGEVRVDRGLKCLEIGADPGCEVGVGDDGGGAFELPELGMDAVRDGEWETEGAECLFHEKLVGWVGEREQEGDGNCLGAAGADGFGEGGERLRGG